MKRMILTLFAFLATLFLVLSHGLLVAQLSTEQLALLDEHVFGGLPSDDSVFIRRGYVMSYDQTRRVPSWVAYHVKPDYLKTPPREGAFKTFRTDPDITNPVKKSEYNGLLAQRGYARGHLAPYAIMGGDRDGDGELAKDGDDFDKQTVFQGNFMSNIAPQNHLDFNGSGGLWFKLERWVQDTAVKTHGHEVSVFAGCIFGVGTHEKVGPNKDIAVPAMFFKIVIRKRPSGEPPKVLAFLFPHQRSRHGDIEDFLVSIDVVESLTGLDFLKDLDDEMENSLEDKDTRDFWTDFLT